MVTLNSYWEMISMSKDFDVRDIYEIKITDEISGGYLVVLGDGSVEVVTA